MSPDLFMELVITYLQGVAVMYLAAGAVTCVVVCWVIDRM